MTLRCVLLLLLLTAAAPAMDLEDVAVLSRQWLTCRHEGYVPQADYNRSGCVDLMDLAILSEEWLMSEVLGQELIVNGGFDPALSGWSGHGAGLYYLDGKLKLIPRKSGGFEILSTDSAVYQDITIVQGKRYRMELDVSVLLPEAADIFCRMYYFDGQIETFQDIPLTNGQINQVVVAEHDFSFIYLGYSDGDINLEANTVVATFDNFSIKEILPTASSLIGAGRLIGQGRMIGDGLPMIGDLNLINN